MLISSPISSLDLGCVSLGRADFHLFSLHFLSLIYLLVDLNDHLRAKQSADFFKGKTLCLYRVETLDTSSPKMQKSIKHTAWKLTSGKKNQKMTKKKQLQAMKTKLNFQPMFSKAMGAVWLKQSVMLHPMKIEITIPRDRILVGRTSAAKANCVERYVHP